MSSTDLHVACCVTGQCGHCIPMCRAASGTAQQPGVKVTLMIPDYVVIKLKTSLKPMLDPRVEVRGIADMYSNEKEKEFYDLCMPNTVKCQKMILAQLSKQWEYWGPAVKDLHSKKKIDFGVIDFFSSGYLPGFYDLKIPYCINQPGPGVLAMYWGWNPISDMSLLGRVLMYVALERFWWWIPEKLQKYKAHEGVILTHSFPGLDPPINFSKRIIHVGVLPVPNPNNLASVKDFIEKEPKLPIVYVSTGTVANLKPQWVLNMHKGLTNPGVWRCIWSLKADKHDCLKGLPLEEFNVAAWQPQADILAHPNCKVCILHAGWGSCSEVCKAGIPVLMCPFLADQPGNANKFELLGMALRVGWKGGDNMNHRITDKDNIEADDIKSKLMKLLMDPQYQAAATRMQDLATQMGGMDFIGKTIASLAKYGDGHYRETEPEYSVLASAPSRINLSVCAIMVTALALLGRPQSEALKNVPAYAAGMLTAMLVCYNGYDPSRVCNGRKWL